MSLEWIPTSLAVVLFLGTATVYLRGSRDKGTIDTLTRSNAALTERVTLLETTGEAQARQIEALTAANLVLQNVANSSELIESLQTDLRDHHGSAMDGLDQIHSDLAGLPVRFAVAMKDTP